MPCAVFLGRASGRVRVVRCEREGAGGREGAPPLRRCSSPGIGSCSLGPHLVRVGVTVRVTVEIRVGVGVRARVSVRVWGSG